MNSRLYNFLLFCSFNINSSYISIYSDIALANNVKKKDEPVCSKIIILTWYHGTRGLLILIPSPFPTPHSPLLCHLSLLSSLSLSFLLLQQQRQQRTTEAETTGNGNNSLLGLRCHLCFLLLHISQICQIQSEE